MNDTVQVITCHDIIMIIPGRKSINDPYISRVFCVYRSFAHSGACVSIGRRFGYLQLQKHTEHKLEVVNVAESAVFALLPLLVAFTFSGAYERFENRKIHILEEANVYDAAYEYIDLVPAKYQPALRADIREYLDLHLASYNDIPYLTKVDNDLDKAIVVHCMEKCGCWM